VLEIGFYGTFYHYFLPQANIIRDPPPFRDYGQDRQKLLLRVLERIERTCALTNKANVNQAILQLLVDWFRCTENPFFVADKEGDVGNLSRAITPESDDDDEEQSYDSPESSSDDDEDDGAKKLKHPASSAETRLMMSKAECLYKEDLNDFFAWAFFGKQVNKLVEWEVKEHARLFGLLQQRYGLAFATKPHPELPTSEGLYQCKPRLMSLEPVNSIYRPLLVYAFVWCIHALGAMVLYLSGYRRYVASTGLVAWHRPGKDPSSPLLPMLFFHGIAPSGLMLYLPMLLAGLATEQDRPIYCFENSSISCTVDWTFTPLTEEETVQGVAETLRHFGHDKSKLSLVGHSFGSCPITWMLVASQQNPLQDRQQCFDIRQVVLLDPVTLMLSEPDTMVNFLYAEQFDKIRMVASSELFTEFYLRRTLAWYNTELWLDQQIPNNRKGNPCQVFIGLAEKDEIINAPKIKQEVLQHFTTGNRQSRQLVYWDGVGHGACVMSPQKWKQIKTIMLEQELKISQQTC
jgi:pimeloyl-ACP methyl ester carboxylesterase